MLSHAANGELIGGITVDVRREREKSSSSVVSQSSTYYEYTTRRAEDWVDD